MEVVGDRIDAGQGLGQCGEDLGINVNTRFSQAFDQRGLQGIGVNTGFDVHDAV